MARLLDRQLVWSRPAALAAVGALLATALGVLGAPAAFAQRDHSRGEHHVLGHQGDHNLLSGYGGFADEAIFNGAQLEHAIPGAAEPLTQPDDITFLDGHLFVAFQNGVGPQGEASSTGNLDSTVVELDRSGHAIDQWDIVGHCDGLTADRATHTVVATVNEDANSSLFTIDPAKGVVVHYQYDEPLPSNGGTDAISFYHGMMLISASAPGTTGAPAPQASYPAVYDVSLDPSTKIAHIQSLFGDEAMARLANLGSDGASEDLALTDPDSNEVVPFYASRFAGDFMLTSQGDQEQVFVSDPGGPFQSLSVLKLSTAVDDTAWPLPWGRLYVTNPTADTINTVVGPFEWGSELVAATPCDSSSAPSTCPGPGYPPNYLGMLDPWTGAITPVPVSGPTLEPKGMLYLR